MGSNISVSILDLTRYSYVKQVHTDQYSIQIPLGLPLPV